MKEKTVKRLPYGNSNFERLISDNYIFVDKTFYIEALEKEANTYQFFIRPRKFGKSLFLSMLTHYYDLLSAERFSALFGELYIGENPTPLRNSYAVMEFDFSGLDTSTPDNFKKSFSGKVQSTVQQFLSSYKSIFAQSNGLINDIEEKQPGVGAMDIAFRVVRDANVKLFIIIDEYDHFANDLIAQGMNDVYKEMVHANGIVRDFYETLKIGTKTVVDRIFITGISPVMIDDLTSGFNIAMNLSLKVCYNNMMGFTEQEVERLMDEAGVERDLIIVDMKWYYNGYLFNKKATDRIYNPSMILYFFYNIIDSGEIPEKIIDDNLKTDYGRLQRLTRNEANRETLLQIVKNEGIIAEVQSKFSIDNLYDNNYFISLLFYMGLLTIEKPAGSVVRLCIPNYSIKTVFWEYILKSAQINAGFAINTEELRLSIFALAYDGQAKPFLDYVSRNIFNRLSNIDLQRFDEKYIKIILLTCLFQSRSYIPVSEAETDTGYVDIYLHRSPLAPDVTYEWLFELKYLKAGEKSLPVHWQKQIRTV